MHIDPNNAATWTVASQTTPMERRLLTVLAWLTNLGHRRRH
ncbi:hypothetical protein [Microbacterium sp. SS28]|nr:hypothetical protein [Microbacterium sp. SS28]